MIISILINFLTSYIFQVIYISIYIYIFDWSIIDVQHPVSSKCKHSESIFQYITKRWLWMYILSLWLVYFVIGNLYISISAYFTHPLHPLFSGSNLFAFLFSVSFSLLLFWLCLFIFFWILDSEYKWNHMVYFFLRLTCFTYFT